MNFEHRKCLVHNEPIYFICIKSHDCPDRRLCPLCVDEDHQPMQIPVVKQRLIERLSEIRNRQQQSNLEGSLKFLELQANDALNELKTITKSIFFKLNNIDGQLCDMLADVLDKKKEILDFQNQKEYNRIIKIIQDKSFVIKIIENQEKIKRIENDIRISAEEFQKVVQNMKRFLNNKFSEQILDDTLLEGPKVMGMKHGDFFYHRNKIPSINFAGKYKFDKKEGFWMEFTETLQKNHIKICFIDYQNEPKIVDFFGSFNQKNNKEGMWLEFIGNQSQIKEYGNYIDGVRIGDWISVDSEGRECGGGKYNQDGKKIDNWLEIETIYFNGIPIQYQGKYVMGQRVGVWKIFQNGDLIGQGVLDDQLVKQGFWKESFTQQNSQEILVGNYQNGIRKGIWKIFQSQNQISSIDQDSFDFLKAQGEFDSQGKKTGLWNEYQQNGIQEFGEYRSDKRQGEWQAIKQEDILWQGCYLDNQKTGKWIHYEKYPNSYLTGNYSADKRIGSWQIIENHQLTGEGELQENGIKKGRWIEYSQDGKQKLSGEYINGKRSGEWIIQKGQKIIEEGQFNEFNQKHGLWIEYKQVTDQESILLIFKQPISLNLKLKGSYNNGKKIGLWKAYNEIDEEIKKYDKQY